MRLKRIHHSYLRFPNFREPSSSEMAVAVLSPLNRLNVRYLLLIVQALGILPTPWELAITFLGVELSEFFDVLEQLSKTNIIKDNKGKTENFIR